MDQQDTTVEQPPSLSLAAHHGFPSTITIRINNQDTGRKVGHFRLCYLEATSSWKLSVFTPKGNEGVIADGADIGGGSTALFEQLHKYASDAYDRFCRYHLVLTEKIKGINNGSLIELGGFRPGYTEKVLSQWVNGFERFKMEYSRYWSNDSLIFQAGWPKITLKPLPWELEDAP